MCMAVSRENIVDEAPCSIMDWLIIGVYVEKSWRENTPLWQAILL